MTTTLELPGATPADTSTGEVLFIGTATVLLRYAGFTILTDPNFLHRGEQVPLGYGLRSTRLTEPAIDLPDLPPLDMVLLSHLHGDHFDPRVERELDKRLPIVTTRVAARMLKGKGFSRSLGVSKWKSRAFTKGGVQVRITAMPGKHGPGPMNAMLPPVMGSMIEFSTNGEPLGPRIY